MSQKSYMPIQVKNPTSFQHLVVIKPGQDIELHLDNDMYPGEINVEVSSNHLILASRDFTNPKRSVYYFKHSLFTLDWAEFSHAMLGEIWIDSKDRLAKLIVMMECLNVEKMRNVTVVNPDCCDLKIKPYSVMEVILCEENNENDFNEHEEWIWEWCPTVDLEIEEIGYNRLNLFTWNNFSSYDMDSPDDMYARFPRFDVNTHAHPGLYQHHFWFRFDNSILDLMNNNDGVNRVGDLKFTGYSNRFCKPNCNVKCCNMSVYVDLRSKFKTKVLETLALKEQLDCVLNLKQSKSKTKTKNQKVQKARKILPFKKEVIINKVPFTSLEEGCKVLSCIPEKEQIPNDYPCENCDDFRGFGSRMRMYYNGINIPDY